MLYARLTRTAWTPNPHSAGGGHPSFEVSPWQGWPRPAPRPDGHALIRPGILIFGRHIVLRELFGANLSCLGCLLDPADDSGFEVLPFFEQLFDALRIGLGRCGQPLIVSRLAGGVGSESTSFYCSQVPGWCGLVWWVAFSYPSFSYRFHGHVTLQTAVTPLRYRAIPPPGDARTNGSRYSKIQTALRPPASRNQ